MSAPGSAASLSFIFALLVGGGMQGCFTIAHGEGFFQIGRRLMSGRKAKFARVVASEMVARSISRQIAEVSEFSAWRTR